MKKSGLACLLSFLLIAGAYAQNEFPNGNYVVIIGAFSNKENANKFCKKPQTKSLKAKVGVNKASNLFYVYTLETKNHEQAIAEVIRLRNETGFKDAWSYNGVGEPVVQKEPEIVTPIVVEEKKEEIPPPPPPVDSAKIKADLKRQREEQIKKEVDAMELGKKKGEKEVLDHIYFFKDAAVLRPESRFMVDRLVKIMKDNPKKKIRIHGHTNGDAPGKIIRRKDSTSDFFSLDGTVEDYGSAKELSEQRANQIRDYLIANGIDKKRMDIKAEGGSKPIYPVDDDRAEANVRVEIEVLTSE